MYPITPEKPNKMDKQSKRGYPSYRDSATTAADRYAVPDEPFAGPATRYVVHAGAVLCTSFFAVFMKGWARIRITETATADPFGYALFAGLIIAFGLSISQRYLIVHKWYDLIMEAVFVSRETRSRTTIGKIALGCFFFSLAIWLGAFAAAWSLWALQNDNSVTAAGIPIITGGATRAGFLEGFGAFILTWANLHYQQNMATFKRKRVVASTVLMGLLEAALFYFLRGYSGGCFSEVEFLSLASISGVFIDDYWIYLVAPIGGTFLAYMAFFWWFRDSLQKKNLL